MIFVTPSLNKKWKEFIFAFSGFGPNFLMILMGSYYSDALNPSALEMGEQFQAIMPGVCYILPALFPILFTIGKIFDGVIDIPFAHITDTLSTKWGRRRPAIAVCFLPMLISYVLCWIPLGGPDAKLFNTLWVSLWSIVFFGTYTMSLIAFYGSFAAVCTDEAQRLRVSGYKSFFDTICYCLVYALVPVILSAAKLQIDRLVFFCTPLMLTMLIPLFMIKEGEKYGYPERQGLKEEKISMGQSLRLTFQNRIFRRWIYVNCCTFFGLQMFLSAMNGLIIGGMGLNGFQMAILNTCAFGPVPVMLYLFNKSKARYGIRATYQSCLLLFAVAILSFFLGSRFLWGDNTGVKLMIGVAGGLCGSWAIGAFFMMSYLAPSQISSVEEKLTGRNHSAMYFAGNAVSSSIVGAISGNLVYEYIKNIFLVKGQGLVWAEAEDALSAPAVAYRHFFQELGSEEAVSAVVFNFGNMVVPFIVVLTCLAGFFLAFRMPRDYSPKLLAREFRTMDPSLDISAFENEEQKEDRAEIIFVQVGLWVLSGSVFGFIWTGFLMGSIKRYRKDFMRLPAYLLSCLVPFVQVVYLLKLRQMLLQLGQEKGIEVKLPKWPLILTSVLFPVLFTNVISLALLQHGMNQIFACEDK